MIAAILIYLLRGALFGWAARRVSEYRSEPDGFWWGFWLGSIGLLFVIFRKPSLQEVKSTPPGSSIRQSWLCTKCGARNPVGKERCQSCTAPKSIPTSAKK